MKFFIRLLIGRERGRGSTGFVLLLSLLMIGCSRQISWDYQTVTGDERTLSTYGHYGWEMVKRDKEPDDEIGPTGRWDYVFRKDSRLVNTDEKEIEALSDDAKRIINEDSRRADKYDPAKKEEVK